MWRHIYFLKFYYHNQYISVSQFGWVISMLLNFSVAEINSVQVSVDLLCVYRYVNVTPDDHIGVSS